jgi:hypothetical protein
MCVDTYRKCAGVICPSCQSVAVRLIDHNHKSLADSNTSRLCQEGRIAIVTNVERGMRWTRAFVNRRVTELRTAKSCGPDISTPISTRRQRLRVAPGMVATKPDHQGEHEAAVKTVAQETPDDPALPVVTTLVCLLFCTRGCGCDRRPAFPAPSVFFEGFRHIARTQKARRENLLSCHCEEQSDEAIQFLDRFADARDDGLILVV